MIKKLIFNDLNYINNKILKIIYILSLLIPAFLLTGPFLPDLCLSIIALLYSFFFLKKNYKNIISIKISKIFLFILSILIISILFSENLRSLKVLFIFRFFLYFYAVLMIINSTKNYMKVYFQIIQIILLIFIFDICFQFLFGFNILGLDPISRGAGDFFAYTSFFSDEKIAGSFLVRLMPVLIFLYFINKDKIKFFNIKIFLLLIASLFCTFISGERMAFFYSILTSISVLIYFIKIDKKNIFFLIIFILVPFFIYALDINRSKQTVKHTFEQIGVTKNNNKVHFFSETHERYAKISLELFLENKFLGVGPKGFRKECVKKYNIEKCNTHPHNIFFQVISELGLLGAIIYIGLISLIIFKIFQCLAKEDAKFMIYLGLFIFLNPFLPSGSLFNNWLLIIHFVSLPYLYVKKYN